MAAFSVTVTHTADWEDHPSEGEHYLTVLDYSAIVTQSSIDNATRWTVTGEHNQFRKNSLYTEGRTVDAAKREAEQAIRERILAVNA